MIGSIGKINVEQTAIVVKKNYHWLFQFSCNIIYTACTCMLKCHRKNFSEQIIKENITQEESEESLYKIWRDKVEEKILSKIQEESKEVMKEN